MSVGYPQARLLKSPSKVSRQHGSNKSHEGVTVTKRVRSKGTDLFSSVTELEENVVAHGCPAPPCAIVI